MSEFNTVVIQGMTIIEMVMAEAAAKRYQMALKRRHQLRASLRNATRHSRFTDPRAKLARFKHDYGTYLELVQDVENAVEYYENKFQLNQLQEAA